MSIMLSAHTAQPISKEHFQNLLNIRSSPELCALLNNSAHWLGIADSKMRVYYAEKSELSKVIL